MPSLSPFALNAHGVSTPRLDFTHPQAPTTKLYHGASIVVDGNIIGRVQSWTPSVYSREGVHKYELNHQTWGRPVDFVPGRATGRTIAMTRTEVWDQELELTLGFGSIFDDLMDQTRPWTSEEYLFRGKNQVYRLWQYTGCWFTERGEGEQAAEGDGSVTVNATIAFVNRIRIV